VSWSWQAGGFSVIFHGRPERAPGLFPGAAEPAQRRFII
jgi:hypothetical protein